MAVILGLAVVWPRIEPALIAKLKNPRHGTQVTV